MGLLANVTELLRWSGPRAPSRHPSGHRMTHDSAPAASVATGEMVAGLPSPGTNLPARFTGIARTGEMAGWAGLRRNSGR